MPKNRLSHPLNALKTGGVIAYPTEAVFGLGCDPDCDIAINKILQIKDRPASKGLILVAANAKQLEKYADFSKLNSVSRKKIFDTWPGPYTWILPAQKTLSKLISGDFDTVAVRVSSHPIVQELCLSFGKPIISTSANISGYVPCETYTEVKEMFSNCENLESIIDEEVLGLSSPSQIHDSITFKRLR